MAGFVLCDVFAERPLAGNPLAVCFGADDWTDDARLALAREFGWSEITFVTHPAPGRAPSVRIWTPTGPLPFAGHPAVGTAVVCARRGILPVGEPASLTLGIGPTPVHVLALDEAGGTASVTSRPPTFGASVGDLSALAASFGLARDDLSTDAPAGVASVGSDVLLVPLRSLDAIGRLRPDPERLPALKSAVGARRPYAFTFETHDATATVHARMLDVDREDPATGSAAGALGAHLVRHGLAEPNRPIVIEQGHCMGRPSRLTVEVSGSREAPGSVTIAGRVFVWGEGRLAGLVSAE